MKSDFAANVCWGSHNADKVQENGDWVEYFALRNRKRATAMSEIEMDEDFLMAMETPGNETQELTGESGSGVKMLAAQEKSITVDSPIHAISQQTHRLPNKPPPAVCVDPTSILSYQTGLSSSVRTSLTKSTHVATKHVITNTQLQESAPGMAVGVSAAHRPGIATKVITKLSMPPAGIIQDPGHFQALDEALTEAKDMINTIQSIKISPPVPTGIHIALVGHRAPDTTSKILPVSVVRGLNPELEDTVLLSAPVDVQKAAHPRIPTPQSEVDGIQVGTTEGSFSSPTVEDLEESYIHGSGVRRDPKVKDNMTAESTEDEIEENLAYLSDSGSASMDLDSDNEEQKEDVSDKRSPVPPCFDDGGEHTVSSLSENTMPRRDASKYPGSSDFSAEKNEPRNVKSAQDPKLKPASAPRIVEWGTTTEKDPFLPAYNNEPFIIFFCEKENPRYSADDSHQARHVYLPDSLVTDHSSTIVDLFFEKHNPSSQFDTDDTICWDPKISKTSKPYSEQSVYIFELIAYHAANGNAEAISLLTKPNKIWGAFLHWWRYVKDGEIAAIRCPWEKERALKMAEVMGAGAGYVDKVQRCVVREKKYADEREDGMWQNHTHPQWLYLFDRGRYNMLQQKGKLPVVRNV